MAKKLVLHLGLPKTATTTMQKHFFSRFEGYQGKEYYLGKPVSDELYSIFHEAQSLQTSGRDWEHELSLWAKRLNFSAYPTQILSQEGLSGWPGPLWPDSSEWPVQKPAPGETPRRSPHPNIDFLTTLRDFLPAEVDLLTIVTLRNQTDFLGSLAAQTSTSQPGAVTSVIERRDAFVDFFTLVTDLETLVGASNHLTLLFEDGVEHNCDRILDFMGASLVDSAAPLKLGGKENVRAVRDSVWEYSVKGKSYRNSAIWLAVRRFFPARLREIMHPGSNRIAAVLDKLNILYGPRESQFVSVSEDERRAIRSYCGPSNTLLAQHLERDLVSLRY